MTDKKIIIGLIGEIAAGKGAAVEYLVKKYNASSYRFSTPLRDLLNRLYLEINRKNMQDISTILRGRFGQGLLANSIAEDVKNDNNKIIVVDGIRRPADIKYLKKLPEFKLVYITAEAKTRYRRLLERGENEDDKNKTFKQFLKDHEAETELEIPEIGGTADYKIDNSGPIEELHRQIDKIIIN